MGRLLLRLAVVLEREVTSRNGKRQMLRRRNEAIRAARRRGVPIPELAARLSLTQYWVQQVIRDPEKTAIEEATQTGRAGPTAGQGAE